MEKGTYSDPKCYCCNREIIMRAYCYSSGLIEFGKRCPKGALPIAIGPDKQVKELIEATCRHGYKTEIVNGRPTKIPGTEQLLVPGIPEAPDQSAGCDALRAYCNWIKRQAPDGVSVF